MTELDIPISILVSQPGNLFRIQRTSQDLDELRRFFATRDILANDDVILESFTIPNTGLRMYIDGDGKRKGLKGNVYSTLYADELMPGFATRDHIVGTALWVGTRPMADYEADLPIDHVAGFISMAVGSSINPITVIQRSNDIWVFDTDSAIGQAVELVQQSREDRSTTAIEMLVDVSPGKWTEIRVGIMDSLSINLHDRRTDRSHG